MVLKRIEAEIAEIWGFEIYDSETEQAIANYVYLTYPGNYVLTLYTSDYTAIRVEFEFRTNNDYLLFILKYS
jgi:hypothetical protein